MEQNIIKSWNSSNFVVKGSVKAKLMPTQVMDTVTVRLRTISTTHWANGNIKAFFVTAENQNIREWRI